MAGTEVQSGRRSSSGRWDLAVVVGLLAAAFLLQRAAPDENPPARFGDETPRDTSAASAAARPRVSRK